jgi:hypothetical protein
MNYLRQEKYLRDHAACRLPPAACRLPSPPNGSVFLARPTALGEVRAAHEGVAVAEERRVEERG